MTRTSRMVLRAFALWTLWVWGTRIWNIVGDDSRSAGFKAVHIVLAAVSVAFAVATWIIASRTPRAGTASGNMSSSAAPRGEGEADGQAGRFERVEGDSTLQ